MTPHIHTLDNGITLIYTPFEHTVSQTLHIEMGAGSRFEDKHNNGTAHFLEHMFFKGGKKYPNAKTVSNALDLLGGHYNGATSKEYASYFVHCSKEDIENGFDILSDILLSPVMDPEEMEKERGVIQEEYARSQEHPQSRLANAFLETMLGKNTNLGRDILGSPESIASLSREDLFAFHAKHYTPENIVVSLAGSNENYEHVRKMATKYFGELKKGLEIPDFKKFQKAQTDAPIIRVEDVKQTHIFLGFPSIGYRDFRKLMVQEMLSTILGDMTSSRLFQNLREDKGLCYGVETDTMNFCDIGIFYAYAAVNNDKAGLALQELMHELKQMKETGPSENEVSFAIQNVRNLIALSSETSKSFAARYARQYRKYGTTYSPEDTIAMIESITRDEIHQMAKEIFDFTSMQLAVCGPQKDLESKMQNALATTS